LTSKTTGLGLVHAVLELIHVFLYNGDSTIIHINSTSTVWNSGVVWLPGVLRRRKLWIQYALKLSSSPQNSTYNTGFKSKFEVFFERKPNEILTLGIRIQPDLHAVGFLKRNAIKSSIPATPPWLLKRLHIDYSIHQSLKDNTSPEIYRNKFFEFCDHYKDFCRLYTDGSRMVDRVAAAVVYRTTTKTIRLPNKSSIFRAISLAMAVIRHSNEKILSLQTLWQAW